MCFSLPLSGTRELGHAAGDIGGSPRWRLDSLLFAAAMMPWWFLCARGCSISCASGLGSRLSLGGCRGSSSHGQIRMSAPRVASYALFDRVYVAVSSHCSCACPAPQIRLHKNVLLPPGGFGTTCAFAPSLKLLNASTQCQEVVSMRGGPRLDLTPAKPGRLESRRVSSVASCHVGNTDSGQHPRRERLRRSEKAIVGREFDERVGATCMARRDGADFAGPEAPCTPNLG